MKYSLFISSLLLVISCEQATTESASKAQVQEQAKSDKIKVLNFGSFHFGYTSDAHSTELDEKDSAVQAEVRKISLMIAEFKPTIICVEALPEEHEALNKAYQYFLANPTELDTRMGELSMIAFDVARQNHVNQIYGIDNYIGYNYSVGDFIENSPELTNSIDPETYLQLTNEPYKDYPEMAAREANYESLSLLEKLKLTNEPLSLDNSINMNADKLLYVGLEDGFEGADNAAKFYQRNMRIFSNLNRIKMDKNDRVFILMGSAHTAFLREFINRSPKYEMVNTLDYLK